MTSIFDDPGFSARLFFPRSVASPPPPGARDLWIGVGGGARLHGRLHEATGSLATILLFHGNGETVPDYDGLAQRFHWARADLAVVDYRGYGLSDGVPTLRSCLADAHAVLQAVRACEPRALPVLVMGRSLGSACAAELAARASPPVEGTLFESGFTDLAAFIARRGLQAPAPLAEEDLADFCPLRKLAAATAPLLVLHGGADELVPTADGEAAFAAAGAKDKRLVLVPGAGHNDLLHHPDYWDAIARFVAEA